MPRLSVVAALLALRCSLFAPFLFAQPTAPAPAPGPDHITVTGFERFYSDDKSDAATGGQLLLGELNCLSCHKAEGVPAGMLFPKQAPILTEIGSRAQMSYFLNFLADPHKTKPGTTMPNVLASLPEVERGEAIQALVSFLAQTGKTQVETVKAAAVRRGDELYHTLGCVACHGSRKDGAATLPTSINLGKPSRKYTYSGLVTFLKNPLAMRPSARMPHFQLSHEDAGDLASYLLKDLAGPAGLTFEVYTGGFQKFPDVSKLKSKASGAAESIDINLAKLGSDYAIRFTGKLQLEKEGDYKFTLTSDDGSNLWIDGKQIVNNDGIHPPATKHGTAKLTAGQHDFQLDFFQGGGGAELTAEVSGPNLANGPLDRIIHSPPPAPTTAPASEKPFVPTAALADKGRQLFGSLGCAACHELQKHGEIPKPTLGPVLAKLKTSGGCLGETATKGVPLFALNARQRKALAAGIEAVQKVTAAPQPKEVVQRTMTALNCYACHERDSVGGIEQARNDSFKTTQPEMGDEARVPPWLTGVGGKLRPEYLRKIFAEGAKDRPYMLAKMPKFGTENIGHLEALFDKLDALPALAKPEGNIAEAKYKSEGRTLAGDKGYSCIKCHTWDKFPAQGVQAISLTVMHNRLREEWFRQYVVDPPKYRPGTRMPTAWPLGQATLKKVLEGKTDQQVYSIWSFISDGTKAQMPSGLIQSSIELGPTETEAVIYRNFIDNLPRAIGVGYPEHVNIAYDANNLRLALVWKNGFIDAKKHWTDRGSGFQTPLGDSVIRLHDGVPLAILESEQTAWPTKSARENDSPFQFRGYTLDKQLRPAFRYTFGSIMVEDFPVGLSDEKAGNFIRRTLTLASTSPAKGLYYRAAVGSTITAETEGMYKLEGGLTLKLTPSGGGKPIVREIAGKKELLVPLVLENGKATLVQDYHW